MLGRLDYWIVDPYSQVLVAEQDDRPAGCLSIHALPYLERTGRWARIECMVVDKALRGTGIGNALLQDAEALAESWGCLAVEVTSSRRRTGAHGFYQRNGYTDICDRSGRFWKDLD
ncbi:GNAT family N-acetyltransferase [Mycobacterium celatum]|uniref:GNAT family N-acetyltransferase n=1 Tax=Mycobacterium celatum TaxID=28045 RepID=UPI0018DDDEC7|nr:GNAT family N-acetyltransferase [Mycobacterium celatum]